MMRGTHVRVKGRFTGQVVEVWYFIPWGENKRDISVLIDEYIAGIDCGRREKHFNMFAL